MLPLVAQLNRERVWRDAGGGRERARCLVTFGERSDAPARNRLGGKRHGWERVGLTYTHS